MTKAREIAELGQKLTVDGSGNLEFAGDLTVDTNTLHVDAANNRVGIKTSSPSYPLTVTGVNASTSAIGIENTTSGHDWYLGASTNPDALVLVDVGSNTTPMSVFYGAPTNSFALKSGVAIFNENGVDQDFRVESDTYSNAIFVNAGTGEVNFDGARTNFGGINVETADGEINAGLIKLRNSNTTSGQFLSIDAEGTSAGQSMIHYWYDGAYRNRFQVAGNTGATVVNESGQNIDFRIESDSISNMFYVDASENEIGINTGDPNAMLGVFQTVGSTAMRLGSLTNEEAVNLRFQGKDGVGAVRYADIKFDAIGGNERLRFQAPNNTSSPQLELSSTYGAVFNEGSADRDFRVESDASTHMLFVDAGNGRVGINDNTPSNTFTVVGNSDFYKAGNNTSGGTIRIGSNRTNNSVQYGVITSQQYANSTESEGVTLIGATNVAAENYINIGGGVDEQNQATIIRVYAAANPTTRHSAGADLIQYMDSDNIVFNDSSRNTDFRIESDYNSKGLFLDAANGTLAVDTSLVVDKNTDIQAIRLGNTQIVSSSKTVDASSTATLLRQNRTAYTFHWAGQIVVTYLDGAYPTRSMSWVYNIALYGHNASNIGQDINLIDGPASTGTGSHTAPTLSWNLSGDSYAELSATTGSNSGGTFYVHFIGSAYGKFVK